SLAAAASNSASSCSDSPSCADFKALLSFFISLRVKVSWKNGTSILVPLADSKVNFSTDMWGLLNKIGYKNGWSRKSQDLGPQQTPPNTAARVPIPYPVGVKPSPGRESSPGRAFR